MFGYREMNANKAYGAGVNINADALTATQRRKAEIEAQSKILKAQRDLEQVRIVNNGSRIFKICVGAGLATIGLTGAGIGIGV
jgi:hypothetical protein